ncbi:Maintenance of mitochondrial morphology protein 1 [Nakaseomyces glabratus]|nr:Maintenance of mitochondrial morphology protein 1 [Nakaseomyces glabratus]KTB17635.1 Maintenance of mitochondrial morphology protein 1 [Nakaseomyces glabratus]KTB19073.1 Maintenance of mitochondrial morphology protein 1 [Nakaseomyces glabratus]KTB21242.1 Maintenance of mitochondrial morphology protein 1 [Nakaseomyces glabratus]
MVSALEMKSIKDSNETLISLDDYIRNTLPSQLHEILLEEFQNQDFSRGQDVSNSTHDQMIDHTLELTSDLLRNALDKQLMEVQSRTLPVRQSNQLISWSFAQGLIIGQLSVVIFLIFFVKFFIFTDASSKMDNPLPSKVSKSYLKNRRESSSIKDKRKGVLVKEESGETDLHGSLQLNDILEKTYYNVDTHSAESLDWFNVLLAQMIQQFREEAWHKDNILTSLDSFIQKRSSDLPDYLDKITITELDIGEDFPIFSNCRIQYAPNSSDRKLEAKIDIDLNDKITFGMSTRLLLNYPKKCTAALPIDLAVSMVRFQACLTVSLITAEELEFTTGNKIDDNEKNGYYLVFSFTPEYKIDFDIKSLIGARSKLENIPKISNIIEYNIKKWFAERCVEPRFQSVKLPGMWPRSKNTREEVIHKTEDESSNTPHS